jgi:hypothetical protein
MRSAVLVAATFLAGAVVIAVLLSANARRATTGRA